MRKKKISKVMISSKIRKQKKKIKFLNKKKRKENKSEAKLKN